MNWVCLKFIVWGIAHNMSSYIAQIASLSASLLVSSGLWSTNPGLRGGTGLIFDQTILLYEENGHIKVVTNYVSSYFHV